MNTPPVRMPAHESHRLFSLYDVAILAGAVVVVTSYAGHWYAAAPAVPAASSNPGAGSPRDVLDSCLLERAPHPAMDQALSRLLAQRAPSSAAPSGAGRARVED